MEAVRGFNSELSSLYETRPPVSRAKMANVTKTAIKAIKFYKHVVQSVEKFIMKCKAEYKIPGLYVIDSIVRQSRHQFGSEKDVFGPRFTKNIVTTFQCLLKCPAEERCRVVRVLNLWQKNAVFPVEVIQPLLDLAADPTSADSVLAAQRAVEKVVAAHQRAHGKVPNAGDEANLLAQQSDIVNTVTRLLQQTEEGSLLASGQEVQLQQLQLLQQQLVMHTEMMSSKPQETPPIIDGNLLAQIKLLTDQLLSKDGPPASSGQKSQMEGLRGSVSDMKKSEPGFNRKLLDFDYGDSDDDDDRKSGSHLGGMSESERKQHLEQQQEQFNKEIGQSQYYGQHDSDVIVVEDQDDRDRDYDRDRRRSRRSRDRSRDSRSPKRRRHSRSRSRERRRSRDRDRHRRSRSEEEEREKQREKERERKKNGLPPAREKHISICSRTLWFGHLAKHTTEDELRAEIQNYGTIENIKMVPPRGCAFVTLTHRKEAAKALDRMKGFKLNHSALKVAWAPNIGVKESQFSDLFDKEIGVTYVSWNKIQGDFSSLLSDAILDEDTVPEHLKGSLMRRVEEEDRDMDIMRPGGHMQENHNHMNQHQNQNQHHNQHHHMNQMPPQFGGHHDQPMPNAQQMPSHMMPPHMMMPPPSGMPPPGMPPPGMRMPGGMMPPQGNPHQGLPPNLMPPPGGPVSTTMSLQMGVSLPQVVSAAASMLQGMPNVSLGMSMDGPHNRPPGMSLNSSSPLMMPGQQPGGPSRGGFPPPGSPFGMPNMRPGMPGMGMRPPFQEPEQAKEWPSDDKLEEEALAEMEDDDDDIDQRMHNQHSPMVSLPMMGMRMGMPGHGGPRGLPIQLSSGSPRPPGMMLGQTVSSTGMPLGLRPTMMGPRMMGSQESAEGLMRQSMSQSLMSQGPMGMRLGMGNPPGPRTTLSPSGLSIGQRLGLPGSPGIRGMGPGGTPIRIVLGQRPSLVRPGAPFGLGDVPSSQGEGGLGDMSPSVSSNGPQGPNMLSGLMMGAALRGGRPGLLGPRPNMPVNGGFRFGPGALGLMGPRPDMMRAPGMEPPGEGPPGSLPLPFGAPGGGSNSNGGGGAAAGDDSPEYGEASESPQYGENFTESSQTTSQDEDLRIDTDMRTDTDLRTDTDMRPQDTDLRPSSAGEVENPVKTKQSRWSNADNDNPTPTPQESVPETNGPTTNVLPAASQDTPNAAALSANQTEVSEA